MTPSFPRTGVSGHAGAVQAEQRYQAVLAVISDGLSISQVAEKVGVSRQTLHTWLARYEAEGLDGLRIGTGTAL
ncbi:transposase [Mycobacterium tuberculosis]|nr:transposase [Mycobacterium tuberculosis]CMJ37960.1 transposase [Mycobacterium tuberculosis]